MRCRKSQRPRVVGAVRSSRRPPDSSRNGSQSVPNAAIAAATPAAVQRFVVQPHDEGRQRRRIAQIARGHPARRPGRQRWTSSSAATTAAVRFVSCRSPTARTASARRHQRRLWSRPVVTGARPIARTISRVRAMRSGFRLSTRGPTSSPAMAQRCRSGALASTLDGRVVAAQRLRHGLAIAALEMPLSQQTPGKDAPFSDDGDQRGEREESARPQHHDGEAFPVEQQVSHGNHRKRPMNLNNHARASRAIPMIEHVGKGRLSTESRGRPRGTEAVQKGNSAAPDPNPIPIFSKDFPPTPIRFVTFRLLFEVLGRIGGSLPSPSCRAARF